MGIFSSFFNIKVCCVSSLESPHRGNSNQYTQYTIFNIKRKLPLIIPNLQLWERVLNSRGKRAVSVRANEGQLYIDVYGLYAG